MKMRLIPLLPALLLLPTCSLGASLYVAKNGIDSNPGTLRRPMLTISRAAAAMKPGDVCYVRAGVYRETVRPALSGDSGRPVVFAAYGKEAVVITGTEAATNWHRWKGNIYSTKIDTKVSQLFVDGKMMNQARWPNTGLDLMHPHLGIAAPGSTATTIRDQSLSFPDGGWVGATAHITPGSLWVSWTRKINSSSLQNFEITVDSISAESAYVIAPNTHYYITNSLAALDVPGEWHYDAASSTLYLYAPDGQNPNHHRVEVKSRKPAFDLSDRSNVQVKGFRIFGATVSMANSSNCLLENCHMKYLTHYVDCDGWGTGMDDSGVVISGHDNEILRCSIDWSAGNGVTLLGNSNKVTNCLIRNVDYAAGDCGGVRAMGRGHIISHNTIYNCGRSGIVHRYLKAGKIEYNNIYNVGLLTTDLGCTYCYETDGEGTVISYNWCHDNHTPNCGIGIYIDNGSPNHIIHHNVCWNNTDSGIRLNTPSQSNLCVNNTLFNNGNAFSFWGPSGNNDQKGSRAINNITLGRTDFGSGIETGQNFSEKNAGIADINKLDFRLLSTSPCVDAGKVVEPITEGYKGKAPDIGAYESDCPAWRPGHDWGEPPVVSY